MSLATEQRNRLLLRARDAIDRSSHRPLDVPALARIAGMSPHHFIRAFGQAFGEPPHRYLQRRRIERAMFLLRTTDRPVSEVCLDVGFQSLGTFSRTFSAVVGCSPSAYRSGTGAGAAADELGAVPSCFARAWTRPSSFGEAPAAART